MPARLRHPLAPGEINHVAFTQHALANTKKPTIRRIAGPMSPAAIAAFRDRFAADLRREAADWAPHETDIVFGEHLSQLASRRNSPACARLRR